ncbi:MAG: hypothetical protein WAT21_05705 [Saprospiraceae bacterium]
MVKIVDENSEIIDEIIGNVPSGCKKLVVWAKVEKYIDGSKIANVNNILYKK